MRFKPLNNLVGWLVFTLACITYALTAEPTGSLWDCGEFISGSYKLQVVHPPGAPFFLLVARLFTWVATIVSADKANIAYSVNLLSGICTAFAAMFTTWITTILGRIALCGRDSEPEGGEMYAILGAGLLAGTAGTFCTSVWFSAVEGEVYAMSLFFTATVIWAVAKWYQLGDEPRNDRWLVFAAYMVGLSVGVHLLSLLTFPGLALLYYFKKNKSVSLKGVLTAGAIGVVLLALVQSGVILYLPKIGGNFDLFFNSSIGLPIGTGLFFFILLIVGGIVFGLRRAAKTGNRNLELGVLGFAFILLGFSTYAMIMIRANANTPINMNNPSDPFSLVSYLSREQYGDRPLLYGPHFAAQPTGTTSSPKYGKVGDHYEIVDQKLDYTYDNSDKMLFPRIGHSDRVDEHELWMGKRDYDRRNPPIPTQADNIEFFLRYQIWHEYVRYFLWNFAGRQNGNQGYFDWDPTDGNWLSGISFIDNSRLYDQSVLPDRLRNDESRNTYFLLPFLFGLLGAFWHFKQKRNEAFAVFSLFIMLGVAIVLYSNQPPNEPRERDYAVAGSMLMYCIWIGMGALAIFDFLRSKLPSVPAAFLSVGVVALAPILMVTQNWNDHNRSSHYGSRDYASNFLNSCDPNAIIFTFGDNDTYPLWYAQEVEGIRTDVRVVNLSLLAVDWYIDQLRRKMNQSPAIKMSIASEKLRGFKRNQIFLPQKEVMGIAEYPVMTIQQFVKFLAEDHPLQMQSGQETETYLPTNKLILPVDTAAARKSGAILPKDSALTALAFTLNKQYLIKDEVAIMDIIASNLWERPIYFAVTCTPDKLLGLGQYTQLEGLALRLVPVRSPGRPEFGGMMGAGRIAENKMFENVTTKFKWGNFNTHKTYIDKSFMPSIVSTRFALLRLAEHLLDQGQPERAVKVVDTYLAGFPNENFQYDYNTAYFLKVYADAANLGDQKTNMYKNDPALQAKLEQFSGKAETVEKLKKHLTILADETAIMAKFYKNPAVTLYYGSDLERIEGQRNEGQNGQPGQIRAGVKDQLIRIAESTGDAAFAQKIKDKLK